MEEINIQHDVKEFINKNSTKDVPPHKFEFISYNSEIDLKKIEIEKVNINNNENNTYVNNNNNNNTITPKTTFNTVKNFISNVFSLNNKSNINVNVNVNYFYFYLLYIK
jgi:hypothetical protein